MLILKKDRPDFKSLFKDYLEEYERLESYNYNSSFYDDDDYDYYYPNNIKFHSNRARYLLDEYQKSFSLNKSNKRGCRGSGKHSGSKCIPLYPKGKSKKRYSDVKNNMFDWRGDDKIIYFYNDIDTPDDVEIFYNVFDFDKFLDEEGISVNDSEIDNLLNRSVSHCCINPIERLKGNNTLLTESSYGNLRWECAESNDELVNVKNKK